MSMNDRGISLESITCKVLVSTHKKLLKSFFEAVIFLLQKIIIKKRDFQAVR